MHPFYLGIDVAKAKLDCALLMPDGKYKTKLFKTTREGFGLRNRWLNQHGARHARVCMQATGIYWQPGAAHLADNGLTASVVNPAQIKAFGAARGVRTKTDKVDAKRSAQLCRALQPPAWTAPALSERPLRALVVRLAALQRMHTQETKRLAVARDNVRAGSAQHIAWLDDEIEQVVKAIEQLIKHDPDLKDKRDLLDSVPGLGERTIATLLAFLADPARFDNARAVAAFAGLNPCQRRSGSSVHGNPRLSKIGHALRRKALYMPMVARYRTPWGHHYRDRLRARGTPPMVIIGAMMRKLIHVA